MFGRNFGDLERVEGATIGEITEALRNLTELQQTRPESTTATKLASLTKAHTYVSKNKFIDGVGETIWRDRRRAIVTEIKADEPRALAVLAGGADFGNVQRQHKGRGQAQEGCMGHLQRHAARHPHGGLRTHTPKFLSIQ